MGKHGVFYWYLRHTLEWANGHRAKFFRVFFLVFLALFLCRSWLQPAVVLFRIYLCELTFLPAVCLASSLGWLRIRRYEKIGFVTKKVEAPFNFLWRRVLRESKVVLALLCATLVYGLLSSHAYLTSYFCFRSLPKVEMTGLPPTGHERIQPLDSIRLLSYEQNNGNLRGSLPHSVRVGPAKGGKYCWTFAMEPGQFVNRIFGSVTKVITIPVEDPSPSFSLENGKSVHFSTGENLLLWKETLGSAVRSLPPWRYPSYVPVDVRYTTDDEGEWVQVVSLRKWEGLSYPMRVFGGVIVVRQDGGGFLHYLKVMFFGDGEYIPPEDIHKYEFLQGQNLVPYDVTRYQAESFKFRRGFLAPLPGVHYDDVMIPDLVDDTTNNDQPYTTFFRYDNIRNQIGADGGGKLYQCVAMEPFQDDVHGLSLTVLGSGDGLGPVAYYDHSLPGRKALIGVASAPKLIMADRPDVYWNNRAPAEQRYLVYIVNGEWMLFYFSSVVTNTEHEKKKGQATAGSRPDIAVVNALTRRVTWFVTLDELRHPETWEKKLLSPE